MSGHPARQGTACSQKEAVHISGALGFVYMLHFASCTQDIGSYQKYKRGIEKYRDWFDPPLQSRRGSLVVPKGPGVGIADIEGLLKDAKPAS